MLPLLLGAPCVAGARPGETAYRRCLVPCDESSPIGTHLEFHFAGMGPPVRVEASYFRDAATVDLAAAKARVELR